VHYFWTEIKLAVPLVLHGDPALLSIIDFTLQVVGIATGVAVALGIPLGLAIGLGRFRGRATCHALANVSMAVPPALVGAVLFLLFEPPAPLGGLQLDLTRRAVIIGQVILALPYTTALTVAAVRALPGDLLGQARRLGAGRLQLAALALREARIGVLAAIIAAAGSALSEVAAAVILGGNDYGYDQTLAGSALYYTNGGYFTQALAVAMVLAAMILILLGGLGILQQYGGGIRWRLRPAA
jgi:tungstate transport system permease protein